MKSSSIDPFASTTKSGQMKCSRLFIYHRLNNHLLLLRPYPEDSPSSIELISSIRYPGDLQFRSTGVQLSIKIKQAIALSKYQFSMAPSLLLSSFARFGNIDGSGGGSDDSLLRMFQKVLS